MSQETWQLVKGVPWNMTVGVRCPTRQDSWWIVLNVLFHMLYEIWRLFEVTFVKSIFYSNILTLKSVICSIIWLPYYYFFILFGINIKQLYKFTFKTIHQLSCFAGFFLEIFKLFIIEKTDKNSSKFIHKTSSTVIGIM